MAHMAADPSKAFDNVVEEDAALEKLGYQQELKRSFGLVGMIGFSFSIVTCWSALSGVLIIGVESGGPRSCFVFSEFQNFTGFNTSYTAILGLLQTAFGMCCYDAPAHMTEEIKNARKEAPKAIVLAVWIGSVTGFIFLIATCFCIGSIDATATSSTGVPIIQIFYDSTGSVAGATCLTALLIVIDIGCANALTAEGGRAVYAFARDRGLPFSDLWSKVEKKKSIPVFAILLTVAVQIALNSIYFGSLTGFNTVISISTEGFYVSYAMPLLVRVLARFTGKETNLDGPWSLGRWGFALNLIGLIFLLFTSITFNFPTLAPVDSENMNYTSAAIGVIMVIAILTWFTTGRRQFTGPESGGVIIEGAPHHSETADAVPLDGEKIVKIG
ncbi:hypothetical protein H2203_008209 [Taxawa tesnikishii (nom. ined.)]|nr:hypothetical protein H2203_008209 [Dothideales sp. JES 119]